MRNLQGIRAPNEVSVGNATAPQAYFLQPSEQIVLAVRLLGQFPYGEVDGWSLGGINMLCPWPRHLIHIASVD